MKIFNRYSSSNQAEAAAGGSRIVFCEVEQRFYSDAQRCVQQLLLFLLQTLISETFLSQHGHSNTHEATCAAANLLRGLHCSRCYLTLTFTACA